MTPANREARAREVLASFGVLHDDETVVFAHIRSMLTFADEHLSERVEVLRDLVLAADRVWRKYGHDEDGTPSDWTEWADVRDAVSAARALTPQPITAPDEGGRQPEGAAEAGDLPTVSMHEDQAFVDAWRAMEAKGYVYGEDALENVHLGWQLARAATPSSQPEVALDALVEALQAQMQLQDEHLPSSLARERGLVWLEGWFDLSVALAAHQPVEGQNG